jgi:hypothetical protein
VLAILGGATAVLSAGTAWLMGGQSGEVRGWPYQGVHLMRGGPMDPGIDVYQVGPDQAWWLATWLAPVAGAFLVCAAWRVARGSRSSGDSRNAALVLACGLAQFVPSLLLETVYDRYLLVGLPAAIVVALSWKPWSRRTNWIAAAALAAFAVVGVEWTRTYVDRATARWQVAEELIEHGAAPGEIIVGFEWEGAHLYLEAVRSLGVKPPYDLDEAYPWQELLQPRIVVVESDVIPPGANVTRSFRPFLARDRRIVAGSRPAAATTLPGNP